LSRCLFGGAFEEAEEAAGEVPFEAVVYLSVVFAFGAAAIDVVLGACVVASPGDGDGVECAVELTVTESGESVSGHTSG
jgi:hypothetical protein